MKYIIGKRIFSSLILAPICLFIIFQGGFIFISFLILCLSISIYEWNRLSFNKPLYIIGIFFLIYSFLNAYWLREFIDNGLFLFLFVIIICIGSDIGGFIIGNIFQGPKLTKISPNKTYAGSFGGYLFSIFFIFVFFESGFFSAKINLDLNIKIILLIIIISTINQLGDLIISYFKRRSNLKDTGKLIPGHGGILDRIDGMIFSIPSFNLIIFFLNLFKI